MPWLRLHSSVKEEWKDEPQGERDGDDDDGRIENTLWNESVVKGEVRAGGDAADEELVPDRQCP